MASFSYFLLFESALRSVRCAFSPYTLSGRNVHEENVTGESEKKDNIETGTT